MSPRKKTFHPRRGPSRTMAFLPWLASAAAVLSACTDPPIDSNTPDPAGVMEGSVLYRGPRPTCVYENGGPVAVRGRVILTLFAFKNPPPPDGSATSAMNLLAIPGSHLFTDLEEACAPEGVDPDPADVITSSVAFTWPELPLGTTGPASYQVRGFYDHDQTFNPFFNITQVPTEGDISGAAVEDPQASPPVIDEIVFGTQDEFPLGQRVGGVTVSLGLPVSTEPPIFYATSTHLSSETGFTLSLGSPIASEELLLGYTETTLHLYDDLGSPEGVELTTALEAAGLEYAIGPNRPEYRWYVRPVDVDGNGVTDHHPALWSDTGIVEQNYLFPIVLLRRRMTEAETSSGVPGVVIVTSLPQHDRGDPEIPPYAEGDILDRDLRVIVPPVAVVITNPALGGVCRVPYFAPNTWIEVYQDDEGPRLAECQELPTGRYDYTALNGLSGATLNGDVFEGGRYSSQNWTAPNALGVPAQFVPAGAPAPSTCAGDASPCALEQSITNAFLIHDPNPDTYHARRHGADVACQQTIGGTVATAPVPAPNWNDQAINAFLASDPDDEFATADQVEAACCEPIAHLCDVPLCDSVEDPNAPGHFVRGAPTHTTEIDWNGERRNLPECLSFLMPAACCPNID